MATDRDGVILSHTRQGDVTIEIRATNEALSDDGGFDQLMMQCLHTVVGLGYRQSMVEKWLERYNE